MSMNPQDYLKKCIRDYPKLKSSYSEFLDLYTRKLWHQLTSKLIQFTNQHSQREPFFSTTAATAASSTLVADLYFNFVAKFASKLNQLSLVTIAIAASTQVPALEERVALFAGLCESKVLLKDPAAAVYALAAKGRAYVAIARRATAAADVRANLIEARAAMDQAQDYIENKVVGLQTVVFAEFYRLGLEYWWTRGTLGLATEEDFFSSGLLYLKYAEFGPRPGEESEPVIAEETSLAAALALAGILGASIFNLGEFVKTKQNKTKTKKGVFHIVSTNTVTCYCVFFFIFICSV